MVLRRYPRARCGRKVGFVVAVLLAASATVGSLTPPANGAEDVRVLCQRDVYGVREYGVKPASCVFTCVDCRADRPVARLVKVRWRKWGAARTRGSGTFVGKRGVRRRAVVYLARPRTCRGQRIYTRARLKVRGRKSTRFVLPGCERLPTPL